MKRSPELEQAFLDAVAETGFVRDGLAAAGIARATYHRWRDSDPGFAARADEALRVGFGALESAAMKRAFEGWQEDVYHQGEVVGHATKYSDRLAEFLLKVHGPDKYRSANRAEVSGPNGGPIHQAIDVTISLVAASDESQAD